MKQPLIVLTGPTASGKTALSIGLAKAIGGEIISADSMQVYRQMDIGTAKIRPEEMDGVPHHLVDAFKSTLEEAKYADFIIHVVDASNPQWDAQMHVVYMTLQDLGVVDKKILTVFNKCDRITGEEILQDFRADKTLRISAKTGMGLDTLKEVFEDMLRDGKVLLKHTFPYEKAGEIQKIRKYGELLKEEYTPEGIYVEAYVPPEL